MLLGLVDSPSEVLEVSESLEKQRKKILPVKGKTLNQGKDSQPNDSFYSESLFVGRSVLVTKSLIKYGLLYLLNISQIYTGLSIFCLHCLNIVFFWSSNVFRVCSFNSFCNLWQFSKANSIMTRLFLKLFNPLPTIALSIPYTFLILAYKALHAYSVAFVLHRPLPPSSLDQPTQFLVPPTAWAFAHAVLLAGTYFHQALSPK